MVPRAMIPRASMMAAMVFMLAAPHAAEAGDKKRIVTPVPTRSGKVVLAPFNPPLSGVFLTSEATLCPRTGKRLTHYYFDGRFADRPDYFRILGK